MGLIELFRRLICLKSREDDKAKISFLNEDYNKSKDKKQEPRHKRNATVIRPYTSEEVFTMREDEIEVNQEYSYPTNYVIEPLPSTNKHPFTLVLDLDNTLVYASTKELKVFDHELAIHYNGRLQKIWVVERPGLRAFLNLVSKYYEVILFTAGIRQYGIKMMKKIDPHRNLSYFLDRRFCTFIGKNSKNQEIFAKKVSILGREQASVLLVDDKEYSFALNQEHGILVPFFDGNCHDDCLEKLGTFLIDCSERGSLKSCDPLKKSNSVNVA